MARWWQCGVSLPRVLFLRALSQLAASWASHLVGGVDAPTPVLSSRHKPGPLLGGCQAIKKKACLLSRSLCCQTVTTRRLGCSLTGAQWRWPGEGREQRLKEIGNICQTSATDEHPAWAERRANVQGRRGMPACMVGTMLGPSPSQRDQPLQGIALGGRVGICRALQTVQRNPDFLFYC